MRKENGEKLVDFKQVVLSIANYVVLLFSSRITVDFTEEATSRGVLSRFSHDIELALFSLRPLARSVTREIEKNERR